MNSCVDDASTLVRTGLVFYALAIVYLFTALAVVCDDYFVASLKLISERMNVSEDVAGAGTDPRMPLLRRSFARSWIPGGRIPP